MKEEERTLNNEIGRIRKMVVEEGSKRDVEVLRRKHQDQ